MSVSAFPVGLCLGCRELAQQDTTRHSPPQMDITPQGVPKLQIVFLGPRRMVPGEDPRHDAGHPAPPLRRDLPAVGGAMAAEAVVRPAHRPAQLAREAAPG
jgi:hypothetical protein